MTPETITTYASVAVAAITAVTFAIVKLVPVIQSLVAQLKLAAIALGIHDDEDLKTIVTSLRTELTTRVSTVESRVLKLEVQHAQLDCIGPECAAITTPSGEAQ